MKKPRIIARLDIKSENVVKGIRFEGLRVMGKPEDLANNYYEQGADELLYIDTVASLYGRNNLLDVVKQTSSKIFIPLTVGGGIRSVEDALRLLECGADKIAINTAIVKDKNLIKKIASTIGSQALVVSIQAKLTNTKNWEVYIENGREKTGIDLFEWIDCVQNEGAGEILLTSIDRDGTQKGFDKDLIECTSKYISVPLIVGGGCKDKNEILKTFNDYDLDAIAIGSILHYKKLKIDELKLFLKKNGLDIVRN